MDSSVPVCSAWPSVKQHYKECTGTGVTLEYTITKCLYIQTIFVKCVVGKLRKPFVKTNSRFRKQYIFIVNSLKIHHDLCISLNIIFPNALVGINLTSTMMNNAKKKKLI